MVLDIKLNEQTPKCYDNVYHFSSDEIERVLSMDIPAALIIELPRMGGSIWQSFTNLLVYFPQGAEMAVFETTINDPTRKEDGFKFYGVFDAYPDYNHSTGFSHPRRFPTAKFPYTVSLSPFMKVRNSPAPDINTTKFRIDCGSVGINGLEVVVYFDNKNRENEWLSLYWYNGSNEYHKERTFIGTWKPHRNMKNNSHPILTWNSREGAIFMDTLPHICHYHEEDEEEEEED